MYLVYLSKTVARIFYAYVKCHTDFQYPLTAVNDSSYLTLDENAHASIDTFAFSYMSRISRLIGLRKRHRKVHDTKSRYENGATRRESRCCTRERERTGECIGEC